MPSKFKEPTLEVAGVHIPINDLPPDIKELTELFTKWDKEKDAAVCEVRKLDAALRSLTLEITQRVGRWQLVQQTEQKAKLEKAR